MIVGLHPQMKSSKHGPQYGGINYDLFAILKL